MMVLVLMMLGSIHAAAATAVAAVGSGMHLERNDRVITMMYDASKKKLKKCQQEKKKKKRQAFFKNSQRYPIRMDSTSYCYQLPSRLTRSPIKAT